jgi:hypothetical protein|uniref:Uncharacterized protein n=1 Tax=viral metagenome TaxID=1070528 RepID=A0A6C0IPU6_9ZZZZ
MTSIKKPQSAFQYYLKAWKDMPKELKVHFIELAKDDKERYEEELLGKEQGEEEEIKKQQIYLQAYSGGCSAVGLDNGSKSYETIGPVVNMIEYTEEEQKKWGVKVKVFEFRTNNGGKWGVHHNQKYHIRTQWGDPNKKGDNIYTYGTNYNYRKDNPYNPIRKFHIMKNIPDYVGAITVHYTSFDNSTWTSQN